MTISPDSIDELDSLLVPLTVFFNILLLKLGMADWIFDKTRICNIHKIALYSL
jgi:hypothetical protein